MKKRVLVSKINRDEGKMIVFTEDRKFLKLSIPDKSSPSPGEMLEIDLPEEEIEKRSANGGKWLFKIYQSNKKWVSAAAMVMILVISMFYGKINETSAAAYVNLDMNSSIHLEVDENGIVQKVEGLDTEGESLVNSIKLDEKDLYSTIQELVQRENSSDGNIEQDEVIVMVSVIQLNETKTPSINEEKIRELINRELELKKLSGYIVINHATQDQWKEAEEFGYTMNEFMLMTHAKEQGVEISANQFHGKHGAAEYMVKNNIPAKQIFPDTCYEVSGETPDSDHMNRIDAKHDENNSDHQNREVQQYEHHGNSTDQESRDHSNMNHNQSSPNAPDTTREEKADDHNIESDRTEQEQTDHNQYQSTSPTQGEMEMNGKPSGTGEHHTKDSPEADRMEHGR